ncbi:MAG: hypothetical protein Ct9H300mP1_21400 [Planctomycetaceae bacterium]|nr:MAG: hypothetical protein Ct9H300mP1_21400 [Planctomycetaceae bacterium]
MSQTITAVCFGCHFSDRVTVLCPGPQGILAACRERADSLKSSAGARRRNEIANRAARTMVQRMVSSGVRKNGLRGFNCVPPRRGMQSVG